MNNEYHGIQAKNATHALCIAAANGLLKEIKLLLRDGAFINGQAENNIGNPLSSAALKGHVKILEFLIEQGADLNARDCDDMTALMNACHLGKVKGSKAAIILIDAGADVNCVRTTDHMTALKFAVHECPQDIIQLLIDKGAEVDGPEGSPLTPLMLAARRNNVDALKVLIDNGANLSLQCKLKWAEGRTAEGLAEMENQKKAFKFLQEARLGSGKSK
jgi:ankyrin repeat protein